MDGAACAVLLLRAHPQADIWITSARGIGFVLRDIATLEEAVRPSVVHVCGVGIEGEIETVASSLRALGERGVSVEWYCGRGYMDEHCPTIASLCKPVFEKRRSNAALVREHLGLGAQGQEVLIDALATEFVENRETKRLPAEHAFWHDFVRASNMRYFKFNDTDATPGAIRKLAGLVPVSAGDRAEVEAFRRDARENLLLG
jgi:hypothetical protein